MGGCHRRSVALHIHHHLGEYVLQGPAVGPAPTPTLNTGALTCLDTKAGDALFEAQKLEDLSGVYASPIGAAGKVYLPGRNGVTVVLKQSDKLEVLATNRLDEKFDASPAAAGKDLFLRGRDYFYCIMEK